MTATTGLSYGTAANQVISAGNGIDYAYRESGDGAVPLVLLQHFRGNLDNWDPALVDALAADRRVVAFDNTGVGASGGKYAAIVAEMARDAHRVPGRDGIRPGRPPRLLPRQLRGAGDHADPAGAVRRLVLASSAPQGAAGMHGWAPDVIGAVGQPQPNPAGVPRRLLRQLRDQPPGRDRRLRPDGGPHHRPRRPDHVGDPARAVRRRLRLGYPQPCTAATGQRDRSHPVFVANGDSDPMILPHYSYLLAGLIPASTDQDLPRLRPRIPLPAPHRIRF